MNMNRMMAIPMDAFNVTLQVTIFTKLSATYGAIIFSYSIMNNVDMFS